MARTVDDYPTRFTLVPPIGCVDRDCAFRPCINPGLNKGAFTPGRGYTSHFAVPIPVCMTRHTQGCPTGSIGIDPDGTRRALLIAPDPEHARCCRRPAYRAAGRASWVCATCGTTVPAFRFARALNALPTTS